MKAEDKDLLEKFMGKKNTFIIPVYQRNYDWKEKNCKRLFDDIEYIDEYELREYFMGAFTVVSPQDTTNELIVIDGQQRLTTISLLLIAMHHLMPEFKPNDDKDYKELYEIKNKFLVDSEDKKLIKLKQVNEDREIYESLFSPNPPERKGKNIYDNYVYLKKRVEKFCNKEEKSILTLYDVLKKMRIVQILLIPDNKGDKPQLVFETINATGKKLSDADLIRNFILMDKNNEEQKKIFKEYWTPIEQKTRFGKDEKTTDFIWCFLMLKEKKYFKYKDVYTEFKSHINKNKEKFYDTLDKLEKFSGHYKILAHEGGLWFEEYYETLRELEQTTCYPYLLSLIDHYKNIEESFKHNMEKILKFIIDYYIKRLINKDETTIYSKFFPTVAKKIKDYQNEGEDYLDAFYRVFENDAPSIPTDETLKEKLCKKDYNFYTLKHAKYLFKKLINHNSKEKIQMNDDITIEHIMPQELTDPWRRMLGEKQAEDDHALCLHNLGNLTVTGHNNKLSNKPFEEKKKIFRESIIPLNDYFGDINIWNKEAIEKRTEDLADKICEILDFGLDPGTQLKDYKNEKKEIFR